MAFLVPARSPSFLSGALMVAGATALFAFGYKQITAEHAPPAVAMPYKGPPLASPAPTVDIDLPDAGAKIQVAILLDTSSSMSGLIDQARSQMWRIVNELAAAKRKGVTPTLEIAVYEYGNSGLQAWNGYIRQVTPFSSDLDTVSEALFSLTTSGGNEYAGQAISRAHGDLSWDADPSTLRLVYIAGNETFAQGPVNYRDAIGAARGSGITVNTIHCGGEEQGANDLWADAASVAGGRYLAIDHNAVVAHIPAPQDDEIARLGGLLNDTYTYYGGGGRAAWDNQVRQDNNAATSGMGSSVQRAVSKSGGMYRNDGWDLVDGFAAGKVKLAEVDKNTLAPELQGLDDDELSAHVAEQQKKRTQIQADIAALEAERRDYVAAQKQANAEVGAKTLDDAIIETLREQGAAVGYDFE